MLADVLEPHDLSILNAALSAEPRGTDAAPIHSITPPGAERSYTSDAVAARAMARGMLAGATFWLVVFAVASI